MPRIIDLAHQRQRALLSQDDLATATGVSRATIQRAEAGFEVSLATARKITVRLGMGPDLVRHGNDSSVKEEAI